MTSDEISIDHVSDTAVWVAYYRAKETERADALFQDPLAKVLIGERGKKIAANMKTVGRYTEWSVISRTVIIDEYIQSLAAEGIDAVINLGAGLDTRPYRMNLPKTLKWIEVDYPQIIQLKNSLLNTEKPQCQLTRIELDLADTEKRKQFLAQVGSESKKILILTEGVIPYLSPDQVSSLAKELQDQASVTYWITEYFNAAVYKYLQASLRTRKMKNAPFLFYPPDWLGFFKERGWISADLKFGADVAIKHGRKIPMPWWANIFRVFMNKEKLEKSSKMAGYILFKKELARPN